MRGTRCAALLFFIATIGTSLSASEAVLSLWRDWVTSVGARDSAIAVMHNGEMAYGEAIGASLETARPIHSISKMITGACVMALIDEGALTLGTRVGDVIDAGNSPAGALTVENVLTHTGGLGPDETQNAIRVATNPRSPTDALVTQRALVRPLRSETGHAYNNENYAVLGEVIAAVTGETTEDACRARVLTGLTSAENREGQGSGLAYGGWAMSMLDLAVFGARYELHGDAPRVSAAPGVDYGPGVLIRDTSAGPNLWHYGGLCLFRRGSGAALFVLPQGLTMAVSYDVCASNEDLRALEQTVLAPAARAMVTAQ